MSEPSTLDRDRHVALVGLMGSGKSTVGRIAADRLGRTLADIDEQVEQAAGRTVAELFASEGEPAFRRFELEALKRTLAHHDPLVIATGGGVVTTADGRQALHLGARVVWLRASPEELAARVGGDTSRPLLHGRDAVDVLRELTNHRSELYRDVADAVVDVDGRPPEDVADEVLDVLGLQP